MYTFVPGCTKRPMLFDRVLGYFENGIPKTRKLHLCQCRACDMLWRPKYQAKIRGLTCTALRIGANVESAIIKPSTKGTPNGTVSNRRRG